MFSLLDLSHLHVVLEHAQREEASARHHHRQEPDAVLLTELPRGGAVIAPRTASPVVIIPAKSIRNIVSILVAEIEDD